MSDVYSNKYRRMQNIFGCLTVHVIPNWHIGHNSNLWILVLFSVFQTRLSVTEWSLTLMLGMYRICIVQNTIQPQQREDASCSRATRSPRCRPCESQNSKQGSDFWLADTITSWPWPLQLRWQTRRLAMLQTREFNYGATAMETPLVCALSKYLCYCSVVCVLCCVVLFRLIWPWVASLELVVNSLFFIFIHLILSLTFFHSFSNMSC